MSEAQLLKQLLKSGSIDLATIAQMANNPSEKDLRKLSKKLSQNPALAMAIAKQQRRQDPRMVKGRKRRKAKIQKRELIKRQDTATTQFERSMASVKEKRRNDRKKLRKLAKKIGIVTLEQYTKSLKILQDPNLSQDDINRHNKITNLYLSQQTSQGQVEDELSLSDSDSDRD